MSRLMETDSRFLSKLSGFPEPRANPRGPLASTFIAKEACDFRVLRQEYARCVICS